MNPITFDRLLLKTAFCCMACDGKIEDIEISQIKTLCSSSSQFKDFDFNTEINVLLQKINAQKKEFINYYIDLLHNSDLNHDEELELLRFAIDTINADNKVEYSEVKFFKIIRHKLKITDESILEKFPEVESWLEDDIVTENYLDKLKKQYFDNLDLPEFDMLITSEAS